MKEKTVNEIKKIAMGIKDIGIDAFCQAIYDHEEAAVQRVADEERTYAIECAAAALVDAQVPDTKIVDLLQKYYRIDGHDAASALGEGRLMVARRKPTAKKSKQTGQSSTRK